MYSMCLRLGDPDDEGVTLWERLAIGAAASSGTLKFLAQESKAIGLQANAIAVLLTRARFPDPNLGDVRRKFFNESCRPRCPHVRAFQILYILIKNGFDVNLPFQGRSPLGLLVSQDAGPIADGLAFLGARLLDAELPNVGPYRIPSVEPCSFVQFPWLICPNLNKKKKKNWARFIDSIDLRSSVEFLEKKFGGALDFNGKRANMALLLQRDGKILFNYFSCSKTDRQDYGWEKDFEGTWMFSADRGLPLIEVQVSNWGEKYEEYCVHFSKLLPITFVPYYSVLGEKKILRLAEIRGHSTPL